MSGFELSLLETITLLRNALSLHPLNFGEGIAWIVTLVRRAGIRTVPQALRLWANQVDTAFSFLV